jgi:transketolase
MPSWDRYEHHQPDVFVPGVPVVSVEAASTFGWAAHADVSVGIDRFGASAPGARVLAELGIEIDNVVAAALAAREGA